MNIGGMGDTLVDRGSDGARTDGRQECRQRFTQHHQLEGEPDAAGDLGAGDSFRGREDGGVFGGGFRKHGAVDIDPAYALAWAGLADCYYQLSSVTMPAQDAMPKAKAAAEKALVIDATLAEPYAILAVVRSQYDWDWTHAEAGFQRALKLNPSHAPGHTYYAFFLAELGRTEEAVREANEAYRLDPLTRWRAANVGWFYYFSRRYDEAIAQLHKVLDLDPKSAVAHVTLALAYEQKGMLEEAAAELRQAASDGRHEAGWSYCLGHVQGLAGQRDQAKNALERLRTLSKTGYVDSYYPGVVHLSLGEKDRAFEWFEKAFQERSEELLF